MATLTLGKSVTTDAVRSKKGDSVFVEHLCNPFTFFVKAEKTVSATRTNDNAGLGAFYHIRRHIRFSTQFICVIRNVFFPKFDHKCLPNK